ncbi:MAG: D-alanine--D-alanine ligase family protein [Minisyncoccota bacterium]
MPLFSQDKIRVGVLRGGPSHEYDVSLQTGEHVLSLLRDMSHIYEPVDIFISKEGDWHYSGLKTSPQKALQHTDVVWNALHGAYGEDGQVQKILQGLRVPFTGSLAVPSALAMNKEMAKDIFLRHSLLTPKHEIITEENFNDEILIYILKNYMHPVIVKPANSGSSVGVALAHGLKELKESIKQAFNLSKKVLVEEHIKGKEATCCVIENARGEKFHALIPIEIQKPKENKLFDYDAKYSGKTRELCPGTFSTKENKQIEQIAKRAHEVLGLSHYSRSDFMITPKGRIYILETNSLPGFTRNSLFPVALKATGWQPKDFVHHVIQLALNK